MSEVQEICGFKKVSAPSRSPERKKTRTTQLVDAMMELSIDEGIEVHINQTGTSLICLIVGHLTGRKFSTKHVADKLSIIYRTL